MDWRNPIIRSGARPLIDFNLLLQNPSFYPAPSPSPSPHPTLQSAGPKDCQILSETVAADARWASLARLSSRVLRPAVELARCLVRASYSSLSPDPHRAAHSPRQETVPRSSEAGKGTEVRVTIELLGPMA